MVCILHTAKRAGFTTVLAMQVKWPLPFLAVPGVISTQGGMGWAFTGLSNLLSDFNFLTDSETEFSLGEFSYVRTVN